MAVMCCPTDIFVQKLIAFYILVEGSIYFCEKSVLRYIKVSDCGWLSGQSDKCAQESILGL